MSPALQVHGGEPVGLFKPYTSEKKKKRGGHSVGSAADVQHWEVICGLQVKAGNLTISSFLFQKKISPAISEQWYPRLWVRGWVHVMDIDYMQIKWSHLKCPVFRYEHLPLRTLLVSCPMTERDICTWFLLPFNFLENSICYKQFLTCFPRHSSLDPSAQALPWLLTSFDISVITLLCMTSC